MPVSPSAAIAAPFSRATASTLAMNSRCSRWALLTSAMVGAAICASRAISPTWFMPSSITAARQPGRRRSSVSGTPMSLLKLPSVANAPSPCQARKIDAIICVTVVLPLLPATATSGIEKRRRQPAARSPRAARRVGDDEARQRRAIEAMLGQRGDGAGRFRLGEEVVGIEALAAQCDEEVARRDAARVAVDARERRGRIADELGRRQQRRELAERRHRPLRERQPGLERLRRVARVRERKPCAADVLVVLVALAGDEDDVGGSAEPTAWRIASARFSITSTSSWPIAPARIWAMMRSGDSRRGLSLVTTTRSASRQAIAPISGRLVASRLPPQPNTHQSLPPRARANGTRAASALSSASGVWA